MQLFRSLLVFFLPGGLVLLVTILGIHFNIVTPWIDKIEKVAPYGILAVGVILGWRFHRSSLALVIFILFLSERSLFYFGTGGSFAFGYDNTVLLTNGILVPINIALFYLIKKRGLFKSSDLSSSSVYFFRDKIVHSVVFRRSR